MRDPNSSLARQMLETTSSGLVHEPWWEQMGPDVSPPTTLYVPSELAETAQKGWKENQPRLIYNIVAVWSVIP